MTNIGQTEIDSHYSDGIITEFLPASKIPPRPPLLKGGWGGILEDKGHKSRIGKNLVMHPFRSTFEGEEHG